MTTELVDRPVETTQAAGGAHGAGTTGDAAGGAALPSPGSFSRPCLPSSAARGARRGPPPASAAAR